MKQTIILASLVLSLAPIRSDASDWARFRGPNGSGVSPDEKAVPAKWSATENMKWKIELPGPGHCSPIVVGDKVFVTYWSGYAEDRNNLGDQKDLRYHMLCLERKDGSTVWDTEITPELPEERYGGMFAEHGYTTHTPASDGEHIFAFFGKTGVAAFDMEGKKLWQTNVGKDLDRRGWGSASSPILYKDFVIVLASIENASLVALDKKTGEEVWKAEAGGLESLWGTPVLADRSDGDKDLVVVTNGELWGMNPDTGKLRWYCEGPGGRSISISAISHDGVVYALGARDGGTTAAKAGGKGDATETHKLWNSQRRGGTGTPVYYDGRIHWVDSGMAYAIDAETGEEIYRERISDGGEAEGPARGFGRGGGREYSSPVVSGDKLFQVSQSGDVTVIKLGEKFELAGTNSFEGDGSRFVATPAVSDGQLFVRSTKYLYCIGE